MEAISLTATKKQIGSEFLNSGKKHNCTNMSRWKNYVVPSFKIYDTS